jgi:hypothetical protein
MLFVVLLPNGMVVEPKWRGGFQTKIDELKPQIVPPLPRGRRSWNGSKTRWGWSTNTWRISGTVTVGDFSYPSGHSSGSELQARILGKLFPTRIDALLTRARQVADGRVVAGVHYASDAEAGIALGDLLFTELENKPEFENDLTAALTKDQISLK